MEEQHHVQPQEQKSDYPAIPQQAPNSTAGLILGILSIPLCCCSYIGVIVGIIGWVLSSKSINAYKANSELYTQSSFNNAKAGKVCAIIGTVLSAIMLIIGIIIQFAYPELMEEYKEVLEEMQNGGGGF